MPGWIIIALSEGREIFLILGMVRFGPEWFVLVRKRLEWSFEEEEEEEEDEGPPPPG